MTAFDLLQSTTADNAEVRPPYDPGKATDQDRLKPGTRPSRRRSAWNSAAWYLPSPPQHDQPEKYRSRLLPFLTRSPGFQAMRKAALSRRRSCVSAFPADHGPLLTLALDRYSVARRQVWPLPSAKRGEIRHLQSAWGTIRLLRSRGSHPQPPASFAILQFQPDNFQTLHFHDCLRGEWSKSKIKRPCADCSVTGPVSLTENL